MTIKNLVILVILGIGLLPTFAVPAEAGGGSFELYGGLFDPDDLELTTYGLRGGYRATDLLGVELTAGLVEGEAAADLELADLSLKIYPGGATGKAQFFLFAGPGYARIDSPFGEPDSFTVNAGVGVDLYLGEVAYLRPDVRSRWFESGDDTEIEVTLALGFAFAR